MEETGNVLPIPKELIERNEANIDSWMNNVSFKPAGKKERLSMMSPEVQKLFENYMDASKTKSDGTSISIYESFKRFGNGSPILTTHAAKVANTIKYGFALGLAVMDLYEKSSGLANLRSLNKAGQLSQDKIAEFQQRQMTGAAVSIFAASYYIVWELSRYNTDEVSNRVLPAITLPEFTIIDALQSTKFGLFYFGQYAASDSLIRDDLSLVKFTIEYFNAILKELDIFKSSLKYTEEFENRTYKLQTSEFVINGFRAELNNYVKAVEFKKVRWDEVVGNTEVKHNCGRSIQSAMCYDVKEQKNPMMELGGMQTITLLYGPPGTGKSMGSAAMATELDERCRDLKIPFLFHPFPSTPVDEYQGASGKRVNAWFLVLKDKTKIIYAPIDDAENVFVSRGNKSISSGIREVIAVFLTATEGASAVRYGNFIIQMLTNRPEDLDSAVLSRVEGRAVINGAVTWQDFMDQDYLWWKKIQDYAPNFINMEAPEDYVYLTNQHRVASLSKLYQHTGELIPQNETARKVFLEVSKHADPKKHHKFDALFFEAIKKACPYITSRDKRNIQTAVSGRGWDFDFDKKWMEDNGVFYAQDYQTKKKMLVEAMLQNLNGVSFAEVRLQETIKYIDVTLNINETKFETSVKERVEQLLIEKEARDRFAKQLLQNGALTEKATS